MWSGSMGTAVPTGWAYGNVQSSECRPFVIDWLLDNTGIPHASCPALREEQ
jgi:hypothetical protein